MTDPAIIAASYAAERNYSHNPDDVIDASDAVGAWGTAKESTTELVDISGNNNIADIHGAMPTEGFIQGRRFTAANSNHLDCGNGGSLALTGNFTLSVLSKCKLSSTGYYNLIGKNVTNDKVYILIHPKSSTKSFIEMRYDGVGDSDRDIPGMADIALIPYILHLFTFVRNGTTCNGYIDGNFVGTFESSDVLNGIQPITIGGVSAQYLDGTVAYSYISISPNTTVNEQSFFNTLARLPFWSVNYTDYPNNVAEYTNNFPYSSSIISSGTFKVDDDKLQCVSAGTMTYSASYEFDGSEFIKVTIGGVEYAGTGTITQGNTTVSVAQGSNKVTIVMGTGDKIEDKIEIQFRDTV